MADDWLKITINELHETSTDYREKAMLNGLINLVQEQEQRIEQLEGQLDGTLWSPQNW